MIPKTFADWKIDPASFRLPPVPVQAKLDEIYNQLLSRTYINSKGRRVMLSIAYGGDQSGEKSQIHRPEYCYSAQGFRLSNIKEGRLFNQSGRLPVRRIWQHKVAVASR